MQDMINKGREDNTK